MTNETYFSSFGEILLFIIGGTLFVLATFFVSRIIRPHRPNAQKLASYETGEAPQGTAWTQFNMRFYIVALVFLLFEVEIVFLFPAATVYSDETLLKQTNGAWGWFAFIEIIIFVFVLAIGLAYAWVKGYLDWVKPEQKPAVYQSPVPHALYAHINEKYKQKPKSS